MSRPTVGRLVVVGILIAVVGASIWLWQRDDDGGDSPNAAGPQEVLEDYYAKIADLDCGFVELATDSYALRLDADGACIVDPEAFFRTRTVEGGEYQVSQLDINKNEATAQVRLVVDGQELSTGIATLVLSDGEWKVDGEQADTT